ncbi:hypothetical protein EF912_27910 [Streptomyces sp. WAC07061]|uniref:hypothetical protein n=1 Tax=Streptomyces sp. WAC07061 TaxID=2487410 RepID=UPI000F7A701A|nr:hypothetical protein [Streptomyces sp. WAC07061]RSS46003.1 hypothetical protein EF912_27910 [Streptomyces sp. WAC07061]
MPKYAVGDQVEYTGIRPLLDTQLGKRVGTISAVDGSGNDVYYTIDGSRVQESAVLRPVPSVPKYKIGDQIDFVPQHFDGVLVDQSQVNATSATVVDVDTRGPVPAYTVSDGGFTSVVEETAVLPAPESFF